MHSGQSKGKIIEIESLVISEVEKELRNSNEKKVFDNLFDNLNLYMLLDLTSTKRSTLYQDMLTERRFHPFESLLYSLSNIQGDLESKELVTLEIYRSTIKESSSNFMG